MKKVSAYEIADKIAALPKMNSIEVFAPAILEIMDGVPSAVWTTLDERPGLFNYMDDRFYMLRQVRNSAIWGPKLFKGLAR